MAALLRGVVITIICTAVGRGVVEYFKLDEEVAHLIGQARTNEHLTAIAWLVSGTIGVCGLAAWELLGLSERLSNIRAPKPEFGSLPFQDYTTEMGIHPGGVAVNFEMAVRVRNTNTKTVEFRCKLEGTANEARFGPINFNGYVAADHTTLLIMRMPGVVTKPANGRAEVAGLFTYDIKYFYPGSPQQPRRTMKEIEFSNGFAVQAAADQRDVRNVIYKVEVEE